MHFGPPYYTSLYFSSNVMSKYNNTRQIFRQNFSVQSSLGQHDFSQHEFAQHEFLRLQKQIFIARFYTYRIQEIQCYANVFGNFFFKSFSNSKNKLKLSLNWLLSIKMKPQYLFKMSKIPLRHSEKKLHFDLHSTNFTQHDFSPATKILLAEG